MLEHLYFLFVLTVAKKVKFSLGECFLKNTNFKNRLGTFLSERHAYKAINNSACNSSLI